MCLHHYNIKPIVQKAAGTQEDKVTDLDEETKKKKRKQVPFTDGVMCVTARAPPN